MSSASFDIRTNVRDFRRTLNRAQRQQLPFAIMLAVNQTAEAATDHTKRAMRSRLDRPKNFTVNSVFAWKARYRRGSRAAGLAAAPTEASVRFKDFAGKGTPAWKYLTPQIRGGQRAAKRHEKALRLRGIIGPSSFVVPGPGEPLDAYGNMRGARLVRILSDLQAFSEGGYLANRTARSAGRGRSRSRFFKPQPGSSLSPGIWERMASGRIRPVLLEVTRAPQYAARFDFFQINERFVRRHFPVSMRTAMRRAMATAR